MVELSSFGVFLRQLTAAGDIGKCVFTGTITWTLNLYGKWVPADCCGGSQQLIKWEEENSRQGELETCCKQTSVALEQIYGKLWHSGISVLGKRHIWYC